MSIEAQLLHSINPLLAQHTYVARSAIAPLYIIVESGIGCSSALRFPFLGVLSRV